MKLTELRCTACHGTLKIDEKNPKIAVCEYCNTHYTLEWEGSEVHLASSEKKAPVSDTWYHPQPSANQQNTGSTNRSGQNHPKKSPKQAAAILAAIVSLATFWVILGVSSAGRTPAKKASAPALSDIQQSAQPSAPMKSEAEKKVEFTGVFEKAVSVIFEKAAEEVTEEEILQIQWMEISFTVDAYKIGYSMENPAVNPDAELIWLSFPRDDSRPSYEVFTRFQGLKRLAFNGSVSSNYVKGLHLTYLSCSADNLQQVAEALDYPEELKELVIDSGLENIEGGSALTGLEKLTLDCYKITDLSYLAQMKQIQSLKLEDADEVSDFSVLSTMPWLEELEVESENLKDLGFVKSLPNLRALAVDSAPILNLDKLADCTSLTSLRIEDCDELTNVRGVEGLVNLERLDIEIPYHCETPDLSRLKQVKELCLDGFSDISTIRGMTALEKLRMDYCTLNDSHVFDSLTQLKEIRFATMSWNAQNLDFIQRIPAIESVNLSGITTYEDISGIFGIPTLQTLILSGMECELDFSKLKENPSLKVLKMNGIRLYTNVKISGGGGIYSIDYDSVELDGNTEFLAKYPNLEALSLAENKLTQIGFAENLKNLKELDIQDNYVTDLKPLAGIQGLRQVNCTGNPIENVLVLGEDVNVIH